MLLPENASITAETRKWIFVSFSVSLVFHIIAACFSFGFHHYDEHYQILEFAAWKAGIVPENTLPWEFKAQIRPTLQPWGAYFTIRFLQAANLHDPFLIATVLRIFAAVVSWASSIFLTLTVLPYIRTNYYRKLCIAISALLYFVVYSHIRFSSENISAALFWFGISLLLFQKRRYNNAKLLPCLLAGFLLGLAVVARLQAVFMVGGAALWIMFIGKYSWKQILIIAIGGISAVFLGSYLDYLFYGSWVNTYYNYFAVNVIQDRASHYGTSPWWFYFTAFLENAQPPISYVLLPLIIWSWIRFPKSIFTWISICFIFPHILIAHKELRFLFPLISALPILITFGLEALTLEYKNFNFNKKWIRIAGILLVAQNLLLLVYISVVPAKTIILPLQEVYNDAKNYKRVMLLIDEALYNNDRGFLRDLEMKYYMRPNTTIVMFTNAETLKYTLDTCKAQTYILLRNKGFDVSEEYAFIKGTAYPVWQELPGNLKPLNFNNWQQRTPVQMLYKVK